MGILRLTGRGGGIILAPRWLLSRCNGVVLAAWDSKSNLTYAPACVNRLRKKGGAVLVFCGSVRSGVTARRWLAQARVALRMALCLTDRGTWVADGVLGCAYPRTERALATISRRGVHILVNLHERSHDPRRLASHGLREVHLPVEDFSAPSADQIKNGVATIREARAAGETVAVHCGGGLGRTGTLLACYLVQVEGLSAREAVERIRRIRPGSVERASQMAAVEIHAHQVQNTR